MTFYNYFSPRGSGCCNCENLPCVFHSGCKSFDQDWNELPLVNGSYGATAAFYKNYGPCAWKVTINNVSTSGVPIGCDTRDCSSFSGVYFIDYVKTGTNLYVTEGNEFVNLRIVPTPSSVVITLGIDISYTQVDGLRYNFGTTLGGWQQYFTKEFHMGDWDCRNLFFDMTNASATRDSNVFCRINPEYITISGVYYPDNKYIYENDITDPVPGVTVNNELDFWNCYYPPATGTFGWVDCSFLGCERLYDTNFLKCSGCFGFTTWYYPVVFNKDNLFIKSIDISGIYDYYQDMSSGILPALACKKCSQLNGLFGYRHIDTLNGDYWTKYIGCTCNNDIRDITLNLVHPSSTLTITSSTLLSNTLTFYCSTPSGMCPSNTLTFNASTSINAPCYGSGAYAVVNLEYKGLSPYGTLAQKWQTQNLVDPVILLGPDCPNTLKAVVTLYDSWELQTNALGCAGSYNCSAYKPPSGVFVLDAETPGPLFCGFQEYSFPVASSVCSPYFIEIHDIYPTPEVRLWLNAPFSVTSPYYRLIATSGVNYACDLRVGNLNNGIPYSGVNFLTQSFNLTGLPVNWGSLCENQYYKWNPSGIIGTLSFTI